MDLQEISDRMEIESLLVRYTRAIDTGDWDRLDEVFTADAEIDYTATGGIAATYPEVKAWLAEMLPLFPRRMHTLGQLAVDLTGGTAAVAAYFHNPMEMAQEAGQEKGRPPLLVEVGGIYHHDLVRTTDGWRSRRLVEELVWKRGL